MHISFDKYEGCGNDFILIDDRTHQLLPYLASYIPSLCHRRKGIGADGVIFVHSSECADYRMRYFNADGREADMCGNGLRCLFRFLLDLNVIDTSAKIESNAGTLSVSLDTQSTQNIRIEMPIPKIEQSIFQLDFGDQSFSIQVIDTGVPHAIVFTEHLDSLDIQSIGSHIRYHPLFQPAGVNVTFVQVHGTGLHIRTYERGVEAETLACGTGAVAAAIGSAISDKSLVPTFIQVASGDLLHVDLHWQDSKICQPALIGPSKHVYSGKFSPFKTKTLHAIPNTELAIH